MIKTLKCGCIEDNGNIVVCSYHKFNKAVAGDPLFTYLIDSAEKIPKFNIYRKTTAIWEDGILVCELCNLEIEECYGCGKQFKEDDIVYCENMGDAHYCEDCEE